MARFIVTNGSYYEPFTYDELVKPLAQMTEAQNAAADNYDTLSLETEALRRYISDNEEDKRAKAIYDNYVNQLNSLQNDLWRNGYNTSTRRGLSAARAGYASDINRIKKAVENRQARSQEYWKARHDDPTLVTGDDPGKSGLDNYLDDDQYGSNWYSYSGAQFANEVGADAKARADEMFADPQIMRDPRLAGYITRIKREGFTSDEVNRAANAVRQSFAGDDKALSSLDPASAILASVLTSHLSSTGAYDKVSPNEYNRLIDYGAAGLSQAIGKTTYQDISDKVWDAEMDFQKWKRQQEYTAKAKAAADKAAGLRIEDTNTIMSKGENHDVAAKDTAKYSNNNSIRLFTKDGKELNNAVQASDLVYSGGLRRQAYERLGFDIGRDTTWDGLLSYSTPSSKFLSGVIRNGDQTIYTTYDPYVRWTDKNGVKHKGGVVVNGDGVSEHVDIALTDYYNTVRKQYEDTVDYYKKNESDVFKAATIDPDSQAKDYKKYNIGFDTPLNQFQEIVMHQPENSVMNYTTSYIARTGTDSGKYIDRFSDLLSGSMDRGKDWFLGSGKGVKKDDNWRQYEGTNMYIHEISKYGTMSSETADPDNIFDFDDNGRITNIEDIQITPASVAGGYLICKTTPSGKAKGKSFAINVDMLNSNALRSSFYQAREALQYIADHPAEFQNPQISGYSSASEAAFDVISGVSRKFKDILGYWTNTQSQGGSSQENRN